MRLIDFIICDDIRRELGNKVSIMGIYTESINLSLPPDTKWPIPFRLGAYVRIALDDIDPIPDKFSVKISQNDKSLAQLRGEITPIGGPSHTITLPIVINPLPLNGLGILRLEVEVLKGNEELLAETHSIEVVQASIPKVQFG
jgi:hypothetical protein